MGNEAHEDGYAAFVAALPGLRAEMHRYLARMTGSVIDGEDVLQDALLSAAVALREGEQVQNLRAWLFRIAHNTALNSFRARGRERAAKAELINLPPNPATNAEAMMPEALTPYMALTPIQRSTMILRDVIGYSAKEVADLTGTSESAVKSALHRGRAALAKARAEHTPARSELDAQNRRLLQEYVRLFNALDFDRILDMLREEVRLELVSVEGRTGKQAVSGYFGNYAKRTDWQMAAGAVEGQPAILAFDRNAPTDRPIYFVLLEFADDRIAGIRDFRYARYAAMDAEYSLP
ncbi:sigma-70 family RNA polymerase sigma factor [uncultured Tateyamaria sp.]|uniref:sigma-70 family RNA polymerase sigma factor n=1 Tax=uncultured Tateyamaria sp. TaxID=455651 RepID=UPI0026209F91|nr:sigma-70 family RNA polymerase sigma factor [uncultured Tateyamaria sp.]